MHDVAWRGMWICVRSKDAQKQLARTSLKLKLRVFSAGHIVAMVTYCATKLTATCSPMIGQFVDTMIWRQPV